MVLKGVWLVSGYGIAKCFESVDNVRAQGNGGVMKKVVVFGGSGFIGRHVVSNLTLRGHNVSVFTRSQEKAAQLKLGGNLGQVQIVPGDVSNSLLVEKLITECDVVINLVGSMSPRKDVLRYLHVTVPGAMAKFAEKHGKMFIHFSAMGSDIAISSVYATSKLEGENTVRGVYKDAVIVKPNLVFGDEDHFFSKFARLARVLPFLPIVGGDSLLQPVYVAELAERVSVMIEKHETGKTIEICGPKTYSLRDLMEFILRVTARNKPVLVLPNVIARVFAFCCEFALVSFILKPLTGNGEPILTMDQLELMKYNITAGDSVGGNVQTLKRSLEKIMPDCLAIYKKRSEGSCA
ncbi:complex I NDUFA9 subunit family protein [Anaplasma capra]|uniref:complex I NDUFA9 subunit family protein n=1 Tax=Anaplasma capra TaxID=1562740 RepID=UPI0021D59A75|nr:complex I NDUFA9 subunit family protein [Anaplasma capra]MCU7611217.1 complex I NDUFA9 subunit family protein [Anaplasma capra]MCU7612279.1 complex I NDUFA9 subunit family protein [Anaplasma capra]